MKKYLLSLFLLLAATAAMGSTKIDGIYYNLYSSTKEAHVTSGSTSYTGVITIPSTVKSGNTTYTVTQVGYSAFYGCKELTSVSIPSTVTYIDHSAFQGCTSLTSVSIPSSVTYIGSNAFYDTPWYNTFAADATNQYGNLVYINNVAYEATSTTITECQFKDNTQGLGGGAFKNCTNIHSITIPASVVNIVGSCFDGCGLTSISVESGNTVYDSRNNCNAIIETATKSLVTGCQNTKIPAEVTKIGYYSYAGRPGLTSVVIPKAITNIVDNAFWGCNNLTSIQVEEGNSIYDSRDNCNAVIETKTDNLFVSCQNTRIPNTVKSIGDYIYQDCNWLTSIRIPNSVISLGDWVLGSCRKLTSITLGSGMQTIGRYAMSFCSKLTEIHSQNPTPPTCESSSFYYNDKSKCTLYVPVGSKTKYAAASVWKDFTNIVEEEVSDKEPYTLLDTQTSFENTTNSTDYSQIDYVRTFSNTDWQTLYVPFSLSYSEWSNDFEIAKLNAVKQYDDNNDGTVDRAELEIILVTEGKTDPNTPYLIKANTTGEKTLSAIADPTLYKAEASSFDFTKANPHFVFTGNYSTLAGTFLKANKYYTLADNRLSTNNNGDLTPFRWYMAITGLLASKSSNAVSLKVGFSFPGETTGLRRITFTDSDTAATIVGYYTTDGIKLDAPRKGVVIVKFSNGTARRMVIR